MQGSLLQKKKKKREKKGFDTLGKMFLKLLSQTGRQE